ncbi:MAG: hypothetical protein MZV70_77560 [Desulfobacterales bacterium]|nr:hypothetical protein [Desulfobacterales bacterium]
MELGQTRSRIAERRVCLAAMGPGLSGSLLALPLDRRPATGDLSCARSVPPPAGGRGKGGGGKTIRKGESRFASLSRDCKERAPSEPFPRLRSTLECN